MRCGSKSRCSCNREPWAGSQVSAAGFGTPAPSQGDDHACGQGGAPRRHWPFYLLLTISVLAGVAQWAYSPSLPAETLIERYANDHSKFIDVGGVKAHVRDQGDPAGIPVVLDPRLEWLAAHVGGLDARARGSSATDLGRPSWPRSHRRLAARRIHGRGLCRFHRGARRHPQSRPRRAGRPLAGRRRRLDLRGDAAGPREPAHPCRSRRAIRTARSHGQSGSRACR